MAKNDLTDKVAYNKVFDKCVYMIYLAGLASGDVVAPIAGISTKAAQDLDLVGKSRTVDYIRVGALTLSTLDFALGLQGTFHSNQEFIETAADAWTAITLMHDLYAHNALMQPVKEAYHDGIEWVKKVYRDHA